MKIISVINQKGGVGKTTSVQNIAIGLAQKGFKVGLVDMDQQKSNLTICFIQDFSNVVVTLPQILKAIVEDNEKIKLGVEHFTATNFENIKILPTNGNINHYFEKIVVNPTQVLKSILPSSGFDYILIDNPPNIETPAFNSIVVSDHIIVVSEPSALSLIGLDEIISKIDLIKDKLNKNVTILGVLLNKCKIKTNQYKEAKNWLQVNSSTKDLVFETSIPDIQEVSKNQSSLLAGMMSTIFQKKAGNIGMYYSDLVNEIIKKTSK
jgi:chromosome partitioning protein